MRRLLFFLLLGIGPPVWAAGTCTVSDVTSSQNASSRVPDSQTVIVTLTCTGDVSTGSFPSTSVPLTGSSPSGSLLNAYNLTGYFLYQVGRTPGATNPTANYTVTVTDAQGFALDLGLLTSNGSASAAQLTTITNAATNYPVVRSALTVAITGNSVASANITLNLIFRTNVTSSVASSGNATQVNGVSVPASATVLASNSSSQLTKAANTLGCLDGYDHLPCTIAQSFGTATGNTNINPLFNAGGTIPSAGIYRLCESYQVTVAGTAGTLFLRGGWTSDGHSNSTAQGIVSQYPSGQSAATQWVGDSACVTTYMDTNSNTYGQVALASVTGNPTIRYSFTIERLE